MKDRKQPENVRFATVTPALTVDDVATSMAWYRDVVGFFVVDEIKHDGKLAGALLRAGHVDVLLLQDDFSKGHDREKGVGFRLYCATRQNINELAAVIKERGGKLDHEPTEQPWGEIDFALVDPDGFRISISTGVED